MAINSYRYKAPGVPISEEEVVLNTITISSDSVGVVGPARKGPFSPTLVTNKKQLVEIFGEDIPGTYALRSAELLLSVTNRVYFQRVGHVGDSPSIVEGDTKEFIGAIRSSSLNGFSVTFAVDGEDVTYKLVKFDEDGNELDVVETLVFTTGTATEEKPALTNFNAYSTTLQCIKDITEVVDTDAMPVGGYVYNKVLEGGVDGFAKGSSLTNIGDATFFFETKTFDSTLNGGSVIILNSAKVNEFKLQVKDANGNLIEEVDRLTQENFVKRVFTNATTVNLVTLDTQEAILAVTAQIIEGGCDGIINHNLPEVNGQPVLYELDLNDFYGDESYPGLMSFEDKDDLDVCFITTPGVNNKAVILKAQEVCEGRGDCIYIADPPPGLTESQVLAWSNGTGVFAEDMYQLNSSYVALYYPWAYQLTDEADLLIPPSAYVLTQIFKSDAASEPWFAAAGLRRGVISHIKSLERNCNKLKDALYGGDEIVNPVIKLGTSGAVIWGNKTTLRPTIEDSVPVLASLNTRRLVNLVKKAVYSASLTFVFEQNDAYTWREWVGTVEPFLDDIMNRRGVYGYKVIMDETTTSSDDINNLVMNGVVYIQPTRSAEYVNVSFKVMPHGAKFE